MMALVFALVLSWMLPLITPVWSGLLGGGLPG
jgi:hypothetical protein